MSAAGQLEVVVVSGMSGAGRSTAAHVLEDLGWFVVDNLPPALLPTMAELAGRSLGAVPRVAAVVDVRGRAFFADLTDSLASLRAQGADVRLLFLEASDEVLVRRFEGVRRPHPLQADETVTKGIERERALLRDLRGDADLIIDTSQLNVHQLRAQIEEAFASSEGPREIHVTVMSFGFKYGLPVDADLVLDLRFLPNPHWVPELRPRTGLDREVSAYVLGQPDAAEFLRRYEELLRLVLPGYLREGKRFVVLAVGCTGGKHRSVAVAEEVGRRLEAAGVDVRVNHRDMGRE